MCCSYSHKNQSPSDFTSQSLMKCKFFIEVTPLYSPCLHSYEVNRKKARSKSVGERQKLKHKVKKEIKVCMHLNNSVRIPIVLPCRELLERSEEMLLSWLRKNYLKDYNCEYIYSVLKHVCAIFIALFCSHAEIMSEQPRQRRYSMICKWANMKLRRREESQEDKTLDNVQ